MAGLVSLWSQASLLGWALQTSPACHKHKQGHAARDSQVYVLPPAMSAACEHACVALQGGSALQKAPGELPQRPGSLLDAAKLLSKQPSPSPRYAALVCSP